MLPGGTASNVVALIARADVALSVVMTTLSTLAAVVLTRRLELLASRYVPVNGWTLFLQVVQVVLLPVALGVVLKQGFPQLARRVQPVMRPWRW